jgi:hypothetical protein
VARSEWLLVAELAVQIKDRTCNDGAKRVYAVLLDELSDRSLEERDGLLRFLALCLRSVDPSPQRVRELTRHVVEHARDSDARSLLTLSDNLLTGTEAPRPAATYLALPVLLAGCGIYRDIVADEIDATLTSRIQSTQRTTPVSDIRLMASLPYALPARNSGDSVPDFWASRAGHNISAHRAAVTAAAETDAYVRLIALTYRLITVKMALAMPGGPTVLFQESHGCFARYEPYFIGVFRALDGDWPSSGETRITGDLAAFGDYLLDHPAPPWIKGAADYAEDGASQDRDSVRATVPLGEFSRTAYLGAAAMIAILAESSQRTFRPPVAALPELVPYQSFRQDAYQPAASSRQGHSGIFGPQFRRTNVSWDVSKLPDLPVPYEFEQIFRGWAALRVTVTGTRLSLRET